MVIIGGGDEADCLGTSHRQGAKSVRNLNRTQAACRARLVPPVAAMALAGLRTESSHEEGGVP